MSTKIRVLGNRLLIAPDEPEYVGRIYIPDSVREEKRTATVLQLGQRLRYQDKPLARRSQRSSAHCQDVKVGDKVWVAVPGWRVPRLIDGKRVYIISAIDVLGIIQS